MNLSTMWLIEILTSINNLANFFFYLILIVVIITSSSSDSYAKEKLLQHSKLIAIVFTVSVLIIVFMPSKELLIEMFGG